MSQPRLSQPRLRIVQDRAKSAPGLDEALSFDAFFAAESQTLFRRMWLITRDRHEAEEIVQDAFLSLYERWDRAAEWDDPTSYLYRTAFNTWKKRTRRAARRVRSVWSSDPGDEFEAADARTVVSAALAHLSPRQRAAVVLTELLGFSSEGAARALGVRPVTARVLASQGRAAMREFLGAADE
jgi:RNA polymerase sigma factor (sigma-70 family)